MAIKKDKKPIDDRPNWKIVERMFIVPSTKGARILMELSQKDVIGNDQKRYLATGEITPYPSDKKNECLSEKYSTHIILDSKEKPLEDLGGHLQYILKKLETSSLYPKYPKIKESREIEETSWDTGARLEHVILKE